MSRDIQLYTPSHLPAAQDDMFHTSLGIPGTAAGSVSAAPPSPVKRIKTLLRGREKLAITLGVLGALIGVTVGWLSQKPQWVSNGVVWIRPIIPRLLDSDKVMPFYVQYVQSQTAIITGPRVLERAVQSNDWKSTGMPSNSDSIAMLKQELAVTYPKNSQHILVSYTNEKDAVAQAAVRSVVRAYRDLYSDTNGQEMKTKLEQIEAKKEELDSAIRMIQGQMRTLTEKQGSEDLSVKYNEMNRHLMDLREKVRSTQMKLESANATDAAAEAQAEAEADPSKGLSLAAIAQADPTMAEYLRTLDAMEVNLQRVGRNAGTRSRIYADALADVELQKQRINTYAETFRASMTDKRFFNPDTMMVVPLSKDMLSQLQRQAEILTKQYEADSVEFKTLSEDWSKILELRQNLARIETEKEKYDRQYEEQVAQAAMGGTLQVVSEGDTPVPAPDKRKQFAFVGLVGGGGLPIAALLLIGLLDGRMRYSEEAGSDMSGMTLLGILPNLPDRLTDPGQAATAAHCVHQIRTMLQISVGEDSNVFAITSSSPGDGKTSLTLALGLSFAASGSRTLLIDCDLVGAGLTARLDMAGPDGVLEAMANRELLPYCRTTDIADLSMLPVGHAQAHHAGMFSPQALRRLLNEAKKHFEIILIDSGPVLGSIEATPVCAAADGVILTVSRGQQRPLVEKAIQHLHSIGARFAGVVFNRAQARDFARSISGISLRSIARQHQTGGATNGNGHRRTEEVKAFGPVARAVATSVKPKSGSNA